MPPASQMESQEGQQGDAEGMPVNAHPKPHHTHSHRIFKVYVTGFGPFRKIAVNASYLIASSLPPVLEEKYVNYGDADAKSTNLQVSIVPHFEPVTVTYDKVEKVISTLYEDLPGVDLFVHIGVAPFNHYQIEKRARKGPYEKQDFDDKYLDGHAARHAAHGKVPENVQEIHTSLDVEGICKHLAEMKEKHPEEKFEPPRPSTDAGLYLCEFILYNSMAETVFDANYEAEYPEPRPISNPTSDPPTTSRAIFIHAPNENDEETVERGLETVKRIIGAIAAQRVTA